MRGRGKKEVATSAVLLVALAALLGGCGGSSTTTGSTEESVKKNANGEYKLVQVEGGKSISRETCLKLQKGLEGELREAVEPSPRPNPPRFSECGLRTKNGLIVVYIDSTVPVRERYLSRVDGIRKGAKNAETRLHPVGGLGEGLEGESGAYWLPSINSLYAYEPDGWLTLLYTQENQTNAERRAGAEALAHRTFELTGQG